MNEERELATKAARAIRGADKRLLVTGAVVALVGLAVLVLVDPWANDVDSGGEFLRRAWAPLLAGVVGTIGFSLMAASFGRFDETGNRKTWYVMVSKIPSVGGLVRWVAQRRDRELVNAPLQSSGDDPFTKS